MLVVIIETIVVIENISKIKEEYLKRKIEEEVIQFMILGM
jgi:hypothetical protein